MPVGTDNLKEWTYTWLPRIFGCHCRSDRSFFYHGRQFPVCARCTGELAGILISLILFWFWQPSPVMSGILLLPLIADGLIQRLTRYESTNMRRLITGILFGIGISALLVSYTVMIFTFGKELGMKWFN